LNLAAAFVVVALATTLVAVGAGSGEAAPKPAPAAKVAPPRTFRQALAVKLAAQLHKPAADVLAALRTAHGAKAAGKSRASARAGRLDRRARRLSARAEALRQGAHVARRAGRARQARDAWAAAVAEPLGVSPADVTAALRALVAERLDSLAGDGWLTAARRDAELACFDDASRCAGIRRPPGLATLRAGL
jgi:hypothetical protein